jgi:hypothetical protein
MKKKLSVVKISLMATLLVTIILGWSNYQNVYASETKSNNKQASSYLEVKQLEMPIIIINTPSNNKISSKDEFTNAIISIISDKGKHQMTDQNMSIKLRGNSSASAAKASYKMKFEKKQNLLNVGTGKGKVWNLVANHYDGSLLRNLTVYHFADSLSGISYSPNCRSIELYLNGEYQGVYLLCEGVNVNKHRVAITSKPDEIEKNGYLIEMSRYDAAHKFDIDIASYSIKSDLSKTESIKEGQVSYIANYIKEAYQAIKNGNKNEVEKYIDLDSFVDIYIANEIVKNVDAGWDSFYMYKDANDKLYFGPMWDYDLAMGNANCAKGFDSYKGVNPYHVLNINANSNPWFCHALSCKWFRNLVAKRWDELQCIINKLPDTVCREAKSNYKSYCRNNKKWDVFGKQTYIEPTQITSLLTYKEHYTYLSNWLSSRINWLTKYYHSKDFINGKFVNEEGNIFTADTNLLELSSILAFGCVPEVDVSYNTTKNLGLSISIRKGGSENWHTQMVASGFILEKGAAYVLSFDYSCSSERSLSFAIQQNHGSYLPYYTGDLKINNTVQHYENTFTASENDTNCSLAFLLGLETFEGSVVTIDNMRLVKK